MQRTGESGLFQRRVPTHRLPVPGEIDEVPDAVVRFERTLGAGIPLVRIRATIRAILPLSGSRLVNGNGKDTTHEGSGQVESDRTLAERWRIISNPSWIFFYSSSLFRSLSWRSQSIRDA